MPHPFYNAHHSPIGAFASLTLGYKGAAGGLGLELAGPANESVYVGLETREGGQYQALPFFEISPDSADDYDVEGNSEFKYPTAVSCFADADVEREMGACIDEWRAGDLTFRIVSPLRSLPDPGETDPESLKEAICPAVLVELTVDNRDVDRPRKTFFGYQGTERSYGMRVLAEGSLKGVGQHTLTAIATDDPDARAGIAFQPERLLLPLADENRQFLVGDLGLLVCNVEPRELRTFRFAVAFFREGTATSGVSTRYLYRRFFDRIEDVLSCALAGFENSLALAHSLDENLRRSLSPDRAWQLAHAISSYMGATQLLEREDGSPLWVVNEGEYRMMNTFDLTVDQAFLELALNPWTLRNVLDLYAERYAYDDGVRFPGEDRVYPGGIAFTHDVGVGNTFSRPGHSGYEQAGLKGCFSYMSAEQLINWVLCAGLYEHHTHDAAWAVSHRETLRACLSSLVQRDNPDPEKRDGVVSLDGARCQGGGEITTYDSLDASLGPAHDNLYLAVKGWAAYRLLENLLRGLDEHKGADVASEQARRAVKTILASADGDGLLPAVIGANTAARIIPAIEALVYPFVLGLPIEDELRSALSRHLRAVLRPGVCLFDDGGWKLSSTSKNSWLSKIYLCQFVAERVLGFEPDATADEAHVSWLLNGRNAYYAWSDQMLAGRAVGSRYYPRGVTAILWTSSGERPLDGLQRFLRGGVYPEAAVAR